LRKTTNKLIAATSPGLVAAIIGLFPQVEISGPVMEEA
jgi:hypothetical protein